MKKKKNLIMISSTCKVGGGPTHMIGLGKLVSDYFNVFYAIPKSNKFSYDLNPSNTIYISERKITLTDILNLIKFINQNSIDLIHSHGKGAGVIGRILKIFLWKPVILTFHGIHLECHNFFYKNIYIFYEILFGLLDEHKIFVSKSEMIYAKKYRLFFRHNYSIVNNSVRNKKSIMDSNLLLKDDSLNKNNFRKNIISINRLVTQKNIFEILKIAKYLTKYNFLIIGDGPLLKDIKAYLKRKEIENVFMLGLKNDVFNYLYNSNLYLSTSLYEGLPISILEAMSVGLPIIASNVVGNCDAVVHNKNGFLYELGDIMNACKFIEYALENDDIYLRLSEGSINKQRNDFGVEKMKSNYLKIYKKYLN